MVLAKGNTAFLSLDIISQSLDIGVNYVRLNLNKLEDTVNSQYFEVRYKEWLKEILFWHALPTNLKELVPTYVTTEVQKTCIPATKDYELKLEEIRKSLAKGLVPFFILENKVFNSH